MTTTERQGKILESLARDQRVRASELAISFGVSEDTVRRDLRELAENGLLRRVYGGAVPRTPTSPEYVDRQAESPDAKAAIAAAAVRFFREGQVVFFDGGTTPMAVARQLPKNLKLTVITHSVPIAMLLSQHPGMEVIVLGGRLLKESVSMVGVETVKGYSQIRADLCVLGISSVHAELGLGVFNYDDGEVKRAMMASAAEIMLVVASEKLGTSSPFIVGPLSVLDRIVTDKDVPAQMTKAIADAAIELVMG